MKFKKVIDGGVKGVVAGKSHSMILKTDGSVWTTGHNGYGQLGQGSTDNRYGQLGQKSTDKQSFGFVEVMKGVQEIGGGCCCYHSIVRKQDGTLWGTGENRESQLGIGYWTNQAHAKNLAFRAITNVA